MESRGITLAAEWERARAAAVHVAWQTWREAIEPLYEGHYDVCEKPEGPCTDADRAADRLIVERLKQDYPEPGYAYLTEESEAQARRRECDRVWIIDPIDGTKDFIKKNGSFAIHIAMVERQETEIWRPVAAAVCWPVAGLMYSAARGAGAWRAKIADGLSDAKAIGRGERIHVSDREELTQLRSAVSNSNRESRLMRFIHSLELEKFWHIGSLGIKVSQIAEGNADFYVNLALGRAKEWDTCAPHLVLEEAGGRMTDLRGNEITYNREDYYLRQGILASNGAAHALLLRRVGNFLEEEAKPKA